MLVVAAVAALCLGGCGDTQPEQQISAFKTVGEEISSKTHDLTDEFKADEAKDPGCFLAKQVIDNGLSTDPESIEEFALSELVGKVQSPEGNYRHKAEEIADVLTEAESGSASETQAAVKAACSS
jgi:hypothetical protein